jgi:hypothetical protein
MTRSTFCFRQAAHAFTFREMAGADGSEVMAALCRVVGEIAVSAASPLDCDHFRLDMF